MLTNKQIENVIEEIKQDPRIDGILVTSSYIYGTPNEQSDLDVFCVTNDGSDWNEVGKRVRFGVDIEACFNPPDKVRYYMQKSKKEGHGDCIHFWAFGRIVFDKSGVLEMLQKEARGFWENGPDSGSSWVWRAEKHKKYQEGIWN